MPNPDLLKHSKQFEKKIIQLHDGIWSAVGFAASNVHMIEGDDSLTIVDTTESTKAAENILKEFRKISQKPIGRIIYTHSHRDHISGASIFAEKPKISIIASETFKSDLIDLDTSAISPNKSLERRTLAQFGIGLESSDRVSLGCGPGDRPMEGLGAGYLKPNKWISSNSEIDLDGITAKLILAPGETEDHLVIWLPNTKILFSGDNWYHAFPNLYAIRGTPYRDFQIWADSLATLANLKPNIMAPGHTMPVFGQEKIHDVLKSTREAILYVIKYTSDGMNHGKSIDDICASINLPKNLKTKPWLGEYYGKLTWAARAFANGTLGWYDGNPTNLGNLSSAKRAKYIAQLAGGLDSLFEQAQKTTDPQWCLELCDHLIALNYPAQNLKASVMKKLAEDEINATARNTYLWEAKKTQNDENPL